MRKWQYNVWSLLNQRPCYIICQNGLKGHIYVIKTSKRFYRLDLEYLWMTIHWIRFNLLTCAHKSQTYNQELKTFLLNFVGHVWITESLILQVLCKCSTTHDLYLNCAVLSSPPLLPPSLAVARALALTFLRMSLWC